MAGSHAGDPVVYLIHFEHKLAHAQHYVGQTDDLERRLHQYKRHNAGGSARIMAGVNRAGIRWACVRVWYGGFELEKYIKRMKKSSLFCPVCTGRLAFEDFSDHAGPPAQEFGDRWRGWTKPRPAHLKAAQRSGPGMDAVLDAVLEFEEGELFTFSDLVRLSGRSRTTVRTAVLKLEYLSIIQPVEGSWPYKYTQIGDTYAVDKVPGNDYRDL